MTNKVDPTITLIGSGAVATGIGSALASAGLAPKEVYSRHIRHAENLASLWGARAIDDLQELTPTADLYIISVSDDAIAGIVERIPRTSGIIVHTSGATPLSALSDTIQHAGVFYPLQTFSRGLSMEGVDIPIYIEATNEGVYTLLHSIANRISKQVYAADSTTRNQLHLSAVFVCNFANHLFAIGERLLEDNGLDPSALRPLIGQTVSKLSQMPARQAQTGPAVRNDEKTMARHIKLLEGNAELQEIYRLLSHSIQTFNL